MQTVKRRRILKLAAVGSVSAAAVMVPATSPAGRHSDGAMHFQATAGLPPSPWPAYATQIIEGRVDLKRGTGLVTSRVLAGHPGDLSNIGLPGMTRLIRITSVSEDGSTLHLRGVVEDRSQLSSGESAQVDLVVDRTK